MSRRPGKKTGAAAALSAPQPPAERPEVGNPPAQQPEAPEENKPPVETPPADKQNPPTQPPAENEKAPIGVYVRYISARKNHVDINYGTGKWDRGQVKDVPADIAKKLLKHTDVYAEPKGKVTGDIEVVKVNVAIAEEEERVLDMHDKINIMGKEEVRDFIERNFGQRVDLRHFQTVESIRSHAVMLFNQYGLP